MLRRVGRQENPIAECGLESVQATDSPQRTQCRNFLLIEAHDKRLVEVDEAVVKRAVVGRGQAQAILDGIDASRGPDRKDMGGVD